MWALLRRGWLSSDSFFLWNSNTTAIKNTIEMKARMIMNKMNLLFASKSSSVQYSWYHFTEFEILCKRFMYPTSSFSVMEILSASGNIIFIAVDRPVN